MDIRTVLVGSLEAWKANPRGITVQDLERLKRQIVRHGVYKPLIVMPAGKRWTVIGGNMRLLALRQLGVKQVDVSVVHPKTEAEVLEYALSDNDRAGRYDQAALSKLLQADLDRIKLEDYRITVGLELPVGDVMKDYGPGMEVKEMELDENLATSHHCKECGYKW